MLKKLTFAVQGNQYSYHAEAARLAADGAVDIVPFEEFGEVVKATLNQKPGLGVAAIQTTAGTVEAAAQAIIKAGRPLVVGRVDLPVQLALVGAESQTIQALDRPGVHCLAQKEAWDQCQDYVKAHLPHLKYEPCPESTAAVREVVERQSKDYIAIGPPQAAHHMSGIVLGPEQINPKSSITSFYILQGDPSQQLLPVDPQKTRPVTVVAVVSPNQDNLTEEVRDIAPLLRCLTYRHTAICEVKGDPESPAVSKFCETTSKKGLKTTILGSYSWQY